MKQRDLVLEQIKHQEYDLVIVGGGIVGAGVAQDAASRGLSVLLIEKSDFASGTSSRTTKLIHGGLRYLEQFQFRLTRELCQERGLLEQLAPHMVRDFSFVLPVKKEKSLFGIKAEIGLSLYDFLSINARGVRRHSRLNARELHDACPSIDARQMAFGLRFHDCITDDSRIVIEVIKSAVRHGAAAINYVEATGFTIQDDRVKAVQCRDRFSGESFDVKCRSCVNAAGVWSDELLKRVEPNWHGRVKPAKGTHIVLPLSVFDTSTALFLPTPDGRYVFVVPWQKALMVGTTDDTYDGPLDEPIATEAEIAYLLQVLNSYAGESLKKKVERTDVIASWAGLRPLVGAEAGTQSSDDSTTSSLSREHFMFEGPGRILGLIGGKLTNYRLLAIHLVDKIVQQLTHDHPVHYKLGPNQTHDMMLGGFDNKQDYLATTAQISARARRLSVEPATIDHLIATYGKDALKVLDDLEANPHLIEKICPYFPPIMAEIPFMIDEEMAISLEDILSRRVRLGFLHQRQCLDAAPKVARLVQKVADWDSARLEVELAHLQHNLGKNLIEI